MYESGRQDAIKIWRTAVNAVSSESLVRRSLFADSSTLTVKNQKIPLSGVGHIEIVGAGKAGAGMARGVEQALSGLPESITRSGWINVPDDCVDKLGFIVLHSARPAGVNEPTQAGVDGTVEIMRRVSRLKPNDICITLLSGGGSALLPAPIRGVSLADKLAVTKLLSSSGASIQELNTVRSRISAVKVGGLARACSAANLVTLIISDVIRDPLDIIASGPTWLSASHDRADPLEVLMRFDPDLSQTPRSIVEALRQPVEYDVSRCSVRNHIIGNNHVALSAAANAARDLGYQVESWGSENAGSASDLGKQLIARLEEVRSVVQNTGQPVCLLAGGETTVQLCDESIRGSGGRNQEVVLSAVVQHPDPVFWRGLSLLSGGTDGEDGPTTSAGAVADEELLVLVHAGKISPERYLRNNNAWPFFDQTGGLLNTGPTHTNVMDVQVGLVHP
ncbi:MAG: DUF4147 domain-containing protein [Fuerstiella sp.]|nr:DUF4147 domain-containing protein [Fuerstiella sp.]